MRSNGGKYVGRGQWQGGPGMQQKAPRHAGLFVLMNHRAGLALTRMIFLTLYVVSEVAHGLRFVRWLVVVLDGLRSITDRWSGGQNGLQRLGKRACADPGRVHLCRLAQWPIDGGRGLHESESPGLLRVVCATHGN